MNSNKLIELIEDELIHLEDVGWIKKNKNVTYMAITQAIYAKIMGMSLIEGLNWFKKYL